MTEPPPKDTLIPCQNCGAELFNAEDTTMTVKPTDADGEPEFEFQGQGNEQEVPAKICPNCGEETPL